MIDEGKDLFEWDPFAGFWRKGDRLYEKKDI